MRRLAVAAAFALATLAVLAVACGRYGAPKRVERSSHPAAESVPLTDPAVAR